MHRILAPIDTNENRVFTQTNFIAGLPEVAEHYKVTLLHVSEEDIHDSPDSVPEIKQALTHLESEGIDTHVTFRVSNMDSPGNEIIEVAEEIDADQIVMGGRKRTPAGKVIFGSVTQSVLRNTEIPVTITGPL